MTETVAPTVVSGTDPPFSAGSGQWVIPGETVVYTITFTNNSPTAFSGATVTDVLPAGLTPVTPLPSGITSSGTGPTTLTADVATLNGGHPIAAQATVTFSYSATVNAGIPATDPTAHNMLEAGWTITPRSGTPIVVTPANGVSYSPDDPLDVTQASPSVSVVDTDPSLDPTNCTAPASNGDVGEGVEVCYLITVSPSTLGTAKLVLTLNTTGGAETDDMQFVTQTVSTHTDQADPLRSGPVSPTRPQTPQ